MTAEKLFEVDTKGWLEDGMVLAFAVEPGGADQSHTTASAMHIL